MSDTKELPLIPDLEPPKTGAAGARPTDEAPKKNKGGRPKGSTTKKTTTTPPPKADTAPRGTRTNRQILKEGIAGLYRTAGMGLGIAPGLMPVGVQCIQQADEIADAWVDACDESPAIRKFWEQMLTTSVYSKLLMAHAPIAVVALGPRVGNLFGGGGKGAEAARGAGESTPRPDTTPPPPNSFDSPVDITGQPDFNPAFG